MNLPMYTVVTIILSCLFWSLIPKGGMLKLQIDWHVLDIRDFFLICLVVDSWSLSNLLVSTFLFWDSFEVRWLIFSFSFIFSFYRDSFNWWWIVAVRSAQIVATGEWFDFDKLCIVCQGIILCSIPQQSIVDSIVALLSSFYLFNMWCIKTAKPYCLS